MKFLAKEYQNRNYLELHISSTIGRDIGANKEAGHLIEGTREELRKLFLDDTKNIWGVKCVITDTPTNIQDLSKPLDKNKLKKKKK